MTPETEHSKAFDRQAVDWSGIAASAEFKELMAAKARFIVPATAFFIVYYLALPLAAGHAPDFMKRVVVGPLNIAYLFALSQFAVAWILAAMYMRAAARFDKQAHNILMKLKGRG